MLSRKKGAEHDQAQTRRSGHDFSERFPYDGAGWEYYRIREAPKKFPEDEQSGANLEVSPLESIAFFQK